MSSRLEIDNLTSSCFIQDDTTLTKRIRFNVENVTGDKIITFRDSDITVVGESNTATITNKTIDANDNTLLHIKNSSIDTNAGIDATKIADGSITNTEYQYLSGATSNIQTQLTTLFDDKISTASNVGLSGIGFFKQKTGTDLEFKNILTGSNKLSITNNVGNNSVDIDLEPSNIDILSLLNAPSSTVVGISDTQSLSNKLLINPKINDSLIDVNGNAFLQIVPTTNAVNGLLLKNAATGSGPSIEPTGTDTNINLLLKPKGTGRLVLDDVMWPEQDGLANQVLTTDGAGNLHYSYADVLVVETTVTTDNVEKNVTTISTVNNSVYLIETDIVAVRADAGHEGTEVVSYKLLSVFKNNNGTVTKTSEQKTVLEDAAAIPCDASVKMVSSNVTITVKGMNSKTFNWKVSYKVTTNSA